MIEIVPDILQLVQPVSSTSAKEIDPNKLGSTYPLNFQFYYGKNNQEEVFNTIYLEDGNPKSDLCLKLFNQSTKSVTFKLVEETISAAGPTQCHFCIRFEKDLQLTPSQISVEPKEQWQVNYLEEKDFFTFYFLHKTGLVLKSKQSANNSDRVLLTLKNLSANNRMVKSTNVELIYGPLLLNGEGASTSQSCKNAISIINHPGNKNIPLQFRFIGPNTVLNDGTSGNSLKLKIFNRPLSGNSRPNLLLDKANSKFIISFEANDNSEALTNLARANNTTITATDTNNWNVEKTQNAAQWTIQLNNNSTINKLKGEEGFELNIANLVTSSASGIAYLYITYQNIGGYPDGQLVVPIEKTPLLYRDQNSTKNVGIGTTSPSAKLEVKGDCKVTESLIFGESTRQMINLWKTEYAIGIQYNTQYFRTGKNFAWYKGGTHDDAALSAGTNGTVQMVINDGNVGIGTTTPSQKLHVVGNLVLGLNEANKKFIFHPRTDTNGDFLQITSDNSDGVWAWSEGIILKRNGDVGIGQQPLPLVKLHVNGRIKDKTGWVMPVGSILPYAGSSAPDGWFLCDGSDKNKTTYADLFSVIGTQYGESGSNFKLPNLKGRVPVGLSTNETEFQSLNKTGGSKTQALTIDQIPSHNHGVNDKGHHHEINPGDDRGQGVCDDASGGGRQAAWTQLAYTGISIKNTGGGEAHNNLQPYITVNYIIKY